MSKKHWPALCTDDYDCYMGIGWMNCHILSCGKDINDKKIHKMPESGEYKYWAKGDGPEK